MHKNSHTWKIKKRHFLKTYTKTNRFEISLIFLNKIMYAQKDTWSTKVLTIISSSGNS